MARLAFSFSVFLLVCVQWHHVHSQSSVPYGIDSFTSEPIYDVADESSSLSTEDNLEDESAYTDSPIPAESDILTAESGEEDVDSGTAGYSESDDSGVLTAADDTNLDNSTVTAADEEGFDMYENDDDSVVGATEVEELGASIGNGGRCSTGNPVDDCWRCDSGWASNRKRLASCGIGYGRNAIGGKNGRIYVVTSAKDDNPANPAPGTLRYAVTRPGPLWILFAYSMDIKLKNELMITSFKTIDGRGVRVRIIGGGGLTLQRISNVLVHGITIQDIKATGPARIMTSTSHTGNRGRCDGDAISIFASNNIWIDHCYLSNSADGLIDVIQGSTAVSITNNYFTKHDKVMLLGASKNDAMDRNMRVTVAYNTFGPGLKQRMPRVRFGSVHVVNNDYIAGWEIYAIAGSEGPTILSQGNIFNADKGSKQVTKRIDDGGAKFGGPKNWNWKSEGDLFLSGAYFTSVPMSWSRQSYSKTASCSPRPASMVHAMCKDSGPLNCRNGARKLLKPGNPQVHVDIRGRG